MPMRQGTPWQHLPLDTQNEIISSLKTLEFSNVNEIKELEFKNVSDQYKVLAKKYHPDVTEQTNISPDKLLELHERFLTIKDAYDRMTELKKQVVLFKVNIDETDKLRQAYEKIFKVAIARERESTYYKNKREEEER